MRIWGKGLLDGLRVTLHNLTHRSVTAQYPDVKPELPVRSRGVIALQEENCTSCMLCARECPSWCIYIDSHKETIPATSEGGRDRQQNVLDRFDIDYSLCMYCGICVDVCPFDALHWSPEFEYATTDIANLTHDKSELREWLWTVPPPAAIEPGRLLPIVEAAPVANGPSAAAQPPAPGGARDRAADPPVASGARDRAADPPVASGEAAGGAEGPEATSPEGGDA